MSKKRQKSHRQNSRSIARKQQRTNNRTRQTQIVQAGQTRPEVKEEPRGWLYDCLFAGLVLIGIGMIVGLFPIAEMPALLALIDAVLIHEVVKGLLNKHMDGLLEAAKVILKLLGDLLRLT